MAKRLLSTFLLLGSSMGSDRLIVEEHPATPAFPATYTVVCGGMAVKDPCEIRKFAGQYLLGKVARVGPDSVDNICTMSQPHSCEYLVQIASCTAARSHIHRELMSAAVSVCVREKFISADPLLGDEGGMSLVTVPEGGADKKMYSYSLASTAIGRKAISLSFRCEGQDFPMSGNDLSRVCRVSGTVTMRNVFKMYPKMKPILCNLEALLCFRSALRLPWNPKTLDFKKFAFNTCNNVKKRPQTWMLDTAEYKGSYVQMYIQNHEGQKHFIITCMPTDTAVTFRCQMASALDNVIVDVAQTICAHAKSPSLRSILRSGSFADDVLCNGGDTQALACALKSGGVCPVPPKGPAALEVIGTNGDEAPPPPAVDVLPDPFMDIPGIQTVIDFTLKSGDRFRAMLYGQLDPQSPGVKTPLYVIHIKCKNGFQSVNPTCRALPGVQIPFSHCVNGRKRSLMERLAMVCRSETLQNAVKSPLCPFTTAEWLGPLAKSTHREEWISAILEELSVAGTPLQLEEVGVFSRLFRSSESPPKTPGRKPRKKVTRKTLQIGGELVEMFKREILAMDNDLNAHCPFSLTVKADKFYEMARAAPPSEPPQDKPKVVAKKPLKRQKKGI